MPMCCCFPVLTVGPVVEHELRDVPRALGAGEPEVPRLPRDEDQAEVDAGDGGGGRGAD